MGLQLACSYSMPGVACGFPWSVCWSWMLDKITGREGRRGRSVGSSGEGHEGEGRLQEVFFCCTSDETEDLDLGVEGEVRDPAVIPAVSQECLLELGAGVVGRVVGGKLAEDLWALVVMGLGAATGGSLQSW